MVFNSLQFFPFFLTVITLYFLIPSWQLKKLLLVIASYIFYALFNPWYVLLLGGGTAVTWLFAELIGRRPENRRLWLLAGVGLPLLALAYFKYTAFALQNVDWLLDYWGADRQWSIAVLALPAGLSFYLFHSISYVVDVYRGAPRARFLDYVLYVAFFPQLVAGPIVRRSQFVPQAEDPATGRIDRDKIGWGLTLLLFGLFQKSVLADAAFADVSNAVFNSASNLSFADAWIGVMAFSGQIFFDFAGYSTCAIGISLCFGFQLPQNFRYPYAAIGFSDFWRRWHISLSSWLRDYLYIPLGGNRHGEFRTYVNLMLTMLLGGLWHGAAWTFVIWGFLHGAYLIAERQLGRLNFASRYWSVVAWLSTLVLTMVTWVFFRAENFTDAIRILQSMFVPATYSIRLLTWDASSIVVGVFTITLLYSLAMRERSFANVWAGMPALPRGLLLGTAILSILLLRGEPREFIYFAF